MKTTYILLSLSLLFVSACSFAPEFKRPEDVVEKSWSVEERFSYDDAGSAVLVSDIPWRDFFKSPAMQEVIAQALENNKDLRTAALNVQRNQALYQVQRAEGLPTLNGQAVGDLSGNFNGDSTETYQVGLAVPSYEIDFFGRVKNLSDAALNEYLATEQAQKSVTIALIAQTADACLQLAADSQSLALARQTFATREKTFDLVEKSYNSGVTTRLDLAQVKVSLEAARADTLLYERLVQLDKNALVQILGVKNLDGLSLMDSLDQVALLAEIPVGLSSEVLLKRPDILQTEYALKKAGANIGAARANFYPRISLTGTLGFSSASLDNLFATSDNFGWGLGPALTLPLFNSGQNQAQLDVALVDQQLAVTAYEQAIQTAFREVADSLTARKSLALQLEAQGQLVRASQETYDLSMKRYTQGIDSYLNVLVAQRSLFEAQQAEVSLQRQELSNKVSLYKVLGGGLAGTGDDTEN